MGGTYKGKKKEGELYWRRKPAKDFYRPRGASLPGVNGPMDCKIIVGKHHEIRVDRGGVMMCGATYFEVPPMGN